MHGQHLGTATRSSSRRALPLPASERLKSPERPLGTLELHGDDAAAPQVSHEESVGGVVLRQCQLGCPSQLTYLIASEGEALVVDPQRDVEHYLRDAEALGAHIRYVALTHTNADFVAGHTELAARGGPGPDRGRVRIAVLPSGDAGWGRPGL